MKTSPATSKENLHRLKQLAIAASHNAYCPYSGFPVGAIVVAESGDEFDGCNVENASYGLAMCAERNAVFQMLAQGQQRIKLVVIYSPTEKPSAPCGACRQVLYEFGPDMRIISFCNGEAQLETSLHELLPHAFGPNSLDQNGSPGA